MNPEAYVEMAATEPTHWWSRAWRRTLDGIIETLSLPHSTRSRSLGAAAPPTLVDAAFHVIFPSKQRLMTAFNLPAGVSLMASAHAE